MKVVVISTLLLIPLIQVWAASTRTVTSSDYGFALDIPNELVNQQERSAIKDQSIMEFTDGLRLLRVSVEPCEGKDFFTKASYVVQRSTAQYEDVEEPCFTFLLKDKKSFMNANGIPAEVFQFQFSDSCTKPGTLTKEERHYYVIDYWGPQAASVLMIYTEHISKTIADQAVVGYSPLSVQ